MTFGQGARACILSHQRSDMRRPAAGLQVPTSEILAKMTHNQSRMKWSVFPSNAWGRACGPVTTSSAHHMLEIFILMAPTTHQIPKCFEHQHVFEFGLGHLTCQRAQPLRNLCITMYEAEGYTVRGRKNEPNGCPCFRD